MKTTIFIKLSIVSMLVCAPTMLVAQERTDSANRLFVNYRAGFNVKARFSTPAFFTTTAPPLAGSGATGNPVSREYEDGFVRVDSSGNALGLTVHWGYNNASQIQGDNVLMHKTVSAADSGVLDRTENPQHGVELLYQRELYRSGNWGAGFEVGFSYTGIDFGASGSKPVNLTRIVDAYSLGGITPPGAPYAGPYEDDGWVPRISDQPTRTIETVPGGTIVNWRKLEGSLHGFRLGPYGEFSLGGGVSFLVSGGFAGGYLNADFSYRDTVLLSGSPLAPPQSGRASHGEFLAGAYAGSMVNVALGESWNVFVGVQWQHLQDWTQRVGAREVKLDMSNCFFVSGGIGWSF